MDDRFSIKKFPQLPQKVYLKVRFIRILERQRRRKKRERRRREETRVASG
jgi:hypothetical protein